MSINIIPVFCSWTSNAIWYRANYMESILWEKAVDSHFQLPWLHGVHFPPCSSLKPRTTSNFATLPRDSLENLPSWPSWTIWGTPEKLRPLLATTSSGSQPTIPLPGEKKKRWKVNVRVCVPVTLMGYLRVWYSASHFYLDTFWHDINSGYSLVNMAYYFLTSALLRNNT